MIFVPVNGVISQALRASKIRGVWPAIVVDNKDGADNPGYRVKLKLPWLNEQETTFWARIAIPMAGPDRGTYVLPENDDQVLVVFEHGDINRPIVVGALWSKKQEPVEVNQSGKNNTKLVKSRCGHRIIFDDKEGAEKITIVDKTKKNKIVLDSVNKIVKIESDGDVEVIAKADVIIHSNALKVGTLESVTGKARSLLTHTARTFGLKASSGITIGGGNTTINTSNAAACNVSGSGAGELGGVAAETPKDQVPEKTGGGGSPAAVEAAAAAGAGLASSTAPFSSPFPGDKAAPDHDEAPETERVEFLVIDEDDQAVRGIKFKVKLADGSQAEHTTDGDGAVVLENAPIGACELVTDIKGLVFESTLEIEGINHRRPSPVDADDQRPAASDLRLAVVEHHRVSTGETLAGLATEAGLTWQDLAKFNFGTDEPAKVNARLRMQVGCRDKTKDGKNYVFNDLDQPGILYIPKPWKGQPLCTSLTHVIYVKRMRIPPRPFVFSM